MDVLTDLAVDVSRYLLLLRQHILSEPSNAHNAILRLQRGEVAIELADIVADDGRQVVAHLGDGKV